MLHYVVFELHFLAPKPLSGFTYRKLSTPGLKSGAPKEVELAHIGAVGLDPQVGFLTL